MALQSIYYFESVDDVTFLYTASEVYETEFKLFELEAQLTGSSFVRISKSCILNVDQLRSVRALLNGKCEAELRNGEKVLISRHYLPEFKKKFGLEEV